MMPKQSKHERTEPAAVASPTFRSAIISRPSLSSSGLKSEVSFDKKEQCGDSLASLEKPAAIGFSPADKIDKECFLGILREKGEGKANSRGTMLARSNWLVDDNVLQLVPSYYPLEKSSRFIIGTSASAITSKISDCCRILSVQIDFNHHNAVGATLKTPEHVEIHLALWRGTGPKHPDCVIVEAQRRRGDAVTYHMYCRRILDAAEGDFDIEEFCELEEREKKRCLVAEKMIASKKRRMGSESAPFDCKNSLLALELAASLLKKDRIDARELGMESLCLLTDPSRAGIDTALIASRVVLTGSAQDEYFDDDEFLSEELGIREAILSLVQFGRLPEEGGFMDEMDSDDEDVMNRYSEGEEYDNPLQKHLALSVLANALNVLENHVSRMGASADVEILSASIADHFLSESKEVSSRDLLSTLLNTLRSAEREPHDACLSARCLGSLCEASNDARRRSNEMNAKSVVAVALDVGRRTHAKLETETEKVLATLEKQVEDDG